MALQHLPQRGKDAFRLLDERWFAVDLDDVAARDDAHAERVPDEAQN